jgi:hypothetical protein
MAYKLLKIDELTRGDHSFLTDDDSCYHIMVYHPRKGFKHGHENDLMQNFKKPMDRKGRPEWSHKIRAIREIASILGQVLSEYKMKGTTIVPVPPSKTKDDARYDDRLMQVLNLMNESHFDGKLDIRELLILKENYRPSHESKDGERLRPEDHKENHKIDKKLCDPTPKTIVLFDDMITAGSHYLGLKELLQEKFPAARIVGIFVFRRIPEDTE